LVEYSDDRCNVLESMVEVSPDSGQFLTRVGILGKF